ncbi:MAG TPA: hypothetical protein VM260_20085 [Pirellula sp.]|nr:hypothetical protein [Pirellula sp.]
MGFKRDWCLRAEDDSVCICRLCQNATADADTHDANESILRRLDEAEQSYALEADE